MPKRPEIKKVLLVGSGPIVIGQACEFDYSGVQAVKALREEGIEVVLLNSNPATVMTDPDLAQHTYIEPITPEVAERIIARERPDSLLPTMGGQTALNLAKRLAEDGTLARYGVRLLGASLEAINRAEDRQLFKAAMERIGLAVPKSGVAHNLEEALALLPSIKLPSIIRPSFTLAGTGGGVAYTQEEFTEICSAGLSASPTSSILVEESVLGWKEYELEVVRDNADNAIVVCSIENIDPMGVHTGDSITVAPAMTLTDQEYQRLRNASLAVLREIGVETGGANVQFAVNPRDGRMVVIEMNPRVSRSSALASKATGYPIAKVATKLALGYTLDEIKNDITRDTLASFEPALDYVVVKIPRFNFEKFPSAERTLTTSMRSVGEVMAIGRTFAEAYQKALRSLDQDAIPLVTQLSLPLAPEARAIALKQGLCRPSPERQAFIAQALWDGLSVEQLHSFTSIDPWFLRELEALVKQARALREVGGIKKLSAAALRQAKRAGFSDIQLAHLLGCTELSVRETRHTQKLHPVYKSVDTCAAEFEAYTPYLYSTYEEEDEAPPSSRQKVMILGSGPIRIGQGIEFDYCCVHAALALREAGYETIMVNCNPETVSTDYDTSDRLYFEPLTAEDVLEIAAREKPLGVIVQFGGQTPLKLSAALEAANVPILGTNPDAIDRAEDRERFADLLASLHLRQPEHGLAKSTSEARAIAERLGFPLMARPSYVLGGRAMEVLRDFPSLERYMNERDASAERPVLLDRFLTDAIEVDLDLIADKDGEVYIGGVLEHIEEAGVHSGDAACTLPPYSLPPATIERLRDQATALARALGVVGLMNVQFAVQGKRVYVLEVNPRASRTIPFIAKATGVPLAKLASLCMVGKRLSELPLPTSTQSAYVAVKESVFPFARFPGVDVILGPEMKSTGEVMGIAPDFAAAFAKSQQAAGVRLPKSGKVFLSVREEDKPDVVDLARRLIVLGFSLVTTQGTGRYLQGKGIDSLEVRKANEVSPNIVDALRAGEIAVVINTSSALPREVSDSYALRREALMRELPYYTTTPAARMLVGALERLSKGELEVHPLQTILQGTR